MEAGTCPCPCSPSQSLLISCGGRAIRVGVASLSVESCWEGRCPGLQTPHCMNQTHHPPASTRREME